jgi:hypothetical protein
VSPTAAERLAELDDHEQRFGLSPDGKKKKAAVEQELLQEFAEEASARAEADANLRAAEADLQEKFRALRSELEVFEHYTASRAAYDLAASTARKRSVSFVPIDRFEVVAIRNDDEGRAVRKLLKAFHAALNRRW